MHTVFFKKDTVVRAIGNFVVEPSVTIEEDSYYLALLNEDTMRATLQRVPDPEDYVDGVPKKPKEIVRRVYKYATGENIPEGATYLSTQVETLAFHETPADGRLIVATENKLVWHYFMVEVDA